MPRGLVVRGAWRSHSALVLLRSVREPFRGRSDEIVSELTLPALLDASLELPLRDDEHAIDEITSKSIGWLANTTP
jgi:hypothetical protein